MEWALLAPYLVGIIACIVHGYWIRNTTYGSLIAPQYEANERKRGARYIVLAPVWPIALVFFAVKEILCLIFEAVGI